MKWGLGPLRLQMGQTAYVNCGGPRVLSWTPGPAPGFTSTSTHDDESIGCSRGVFSMRLFGGHGPDVGLHIPMGLSELITTIIDFNLSTSEFRVGSLVTFISYHFPPPHVYFNSSGPPTRVRRGVSSSVHLRWRASSGFVSEFIPVSDASYARRRRLRLTGIVLCFGSYGSCKNKDL